MKKICDRDYSGASMFTVKQINGVGCCPSCEHPTMMHGKTIENRALYWSLAGDTGISSEAICAHMTGNANKRPHPPSDASDRGRCIRLLLLIPEWIPRLDEMTMYDAALSETLVISSSGLSSERNTWAAQIPLIRKEGYL